MKEFAWVSSRSLIFYIFHMFFAIAGFKKVADAMMEQGLF